MKELLITSLLGIAVLALDVVKWRKAILPVILLGLAGTVASCIIDWGMNENPFSNNMLLMDNFALGSIVVLSVLAFFWFLISSDYFVNEITRTDLYALVIFSFAGTMVLSAYTNMVMLFLGIEILSIPMYALATSNKRELTSNEAGFKYFFLGSLASAILLFGIALVYGAVGSFDLEAIREHLETSGSGTILTAGILMILVGFFFKVSIAPFHMWTPDVYQGSPTVITALMSTVVKGAGFIAMFRLFQLAIPSALEYTVEIFVTLTALTLIVANVMAVIQTNTKRMLAYSSISHAAFMLGAVMTSDRINPNILLYYILVYGVASLVSFTVLYQVSKIQNGAEGFDAFKGLVRRSPLMAGAMTLALLSMAGIPPLAGFMAKYFVISAVLDAGHVWLVILMILSSAVAVYYYLKFIAAMFTPIDNAGRIILNDVQRLVMVLFSTALVALFFLAAFL